MGRVIRRMTDPTNIVGPKEFTDRTGLTRQTFYNCLKQMKSAGVIGDDVKRIDMDCQWMINYMQNNGVAQKRHVSVPDRPPSQSTVDIGAMPDIAELNHLEQLEKVRKLQLDNAIKSKTVVSKKYVQAMIDCQDEANNNIIVDGQASFLPRLIRKIKGGATDEECSEFWNNEVGKILSPVKPRMKRIMRKAMDD